MSDRSKTAKKGIILQSATIQQYEAQKKAEEQYLMSDNNEIPPMKATNLSKSGNKTVREEVIDYIEERSREGFAPLSKASENDTRSEVEVAVFEALRKAGVGRKSTINPSGGYYGVEEENERSFNADPMRHVLRKSYETGGFWGDETEYTPEEKEFIAKMTSMWIEGKFNTPGDELMAETLADGIARGRITMTSIGDLKELG